MDIANLGIRADSSEVVEATKDLDRFVEASERVDKANEQVAESSNRVSKTHEAMAAKAQRMSTMFESGGRNVETFGKRVRQSEQDTSIFRRTLDMLNAPFAALKNNLSISEKSTGLLRRGIDAVNQRLAVYRTTLASADKQTSLFNRTITGLGNMMRTTFGGMLGTIVAGLGIDYVRRATDTYTELGNRLSAAGAEGEVFTQVQERLFEAANRNGVQISALGQLYSRASLSSESLGASQSKLLDFTDGVTAALKVQGGSAESASGALLQLSQALGSGVIRAEEFNSILEGALPIARAAAEGWNETGISVAQLRNLVIAGEVSSKEFFDAFLRGSEDLKATAEGMNLTIGAAFVTLNNGIIAFIGSLDQATGASRAVATVIQGVGLALTFMGENLGMVIEFLAPLAPVMLAVFGPSVLAMVLSLASAVGTTLLGAVSALFALILTNPLTAFLAVVVTVISYMVNWEVAIRNLIQAWSYFMVLWNEFWGNAEGTEYWIRVGLDAGDIVDKLMGVAEETKARIAEGFNVGGNDAGGKILGAMAQGGTDAANKIGQSMQMTGEKANAIWESLNGKVVQPIGKALVDGSNYFYNQATGAIEKAGNSASESMYEAITESTDAANEKTRETGIQISGQMSTVMTDFLVGFRTFGGDLIHAMNTASAIVSSQLGIMQAQTALLQAQAREANANAQLLLKQAADVGRRSTRSGSGGGSSNGGFNFQNYGHETTRDMLDNRGNGGNWFVSSSGGGFERGGSFTVPGNGGRDSQRVAFNATPGERVTIRTPQQQESQTAQQPVQLQVINVTDPREVPAAMDTRDGNRAMINMLRNNRDEVNSILGVSPS